MKKTGAGKKLGEGRVGCWLRMVRGGPLHRMVTSSSTDVNYMMDLQMLDMPEVNDAIGHYRMCFWDLLRQANKY